MRLDKYLSMIGYTRKQAKQLAAAGRVKVGGQVVRDAALHVLDGAEVLLDSRPVEVETHRHIMVHKPKGVITATEDFSGKPTVLDLVPKALLRQGLGPVGRLDKDVSGLVILTTDGQLAHRLISPKWLVEKRYRAVVDGELTSEHVRRMADGIALKDFTCMPAKMTIIGAREAELIITEGKYHQVKRMFGALERPVLELRRLSIGGVELDPNLPYGECRLLTEPEVRALYELVSLGIR